MSTRKTVKYYKYFLFDLSFLWMKATLILFKSGCIFLTKPPKYVLEKRNKSEGGAKEVWNLKRKWDNWENETTDIII